MWPFSRKKEVSKPAASGVSRRAASPSYPARSYSEPARRDDGSDLTNPLNIASPLSPLNPIYQSWEAPTSSSCDSESSSSSSSYDSGSSSSYDSGSSSSCSSD